MARPELCTILVLVMTGWVQGPRRSESQLLRLPCFRLQSQSQAGSDWLHEQSQLKVHMPENKAEKKASNGEDRLPKGITF